MHLVVVGVNHNTAPVELREKLSMDEGQLGQALSTIKSGARVSEACIVSTCNRTEVYAVTHARADDAALIDFLCNYSGVEHEQLEECAFVRSGHHAARHLFEVSCGLDSLALGETQILGQVKNAYCIAEDLGATSGVLNNLFQRAISIGKRARTETNISRGAYSIGAAAAHLAKFVLLVLCQPGRFQPAGQIFIDDVLEAIE